MIQKETYSLENIKRIREKYNVDPELAQRAVFALGLVEALVKAGTQFVFKGGSSLMILFEVPKRLSTDVDILVEPNYDIETHIKKVAEIFPFISYEESIRKTNKSISKKHFKINYKSPRTNRKVVVLLDVLFAKNRYKKLEQKEIKNDLLICRGDNLLVNIPSIEEMLADKLTAFAPHTIGINFYNSDFSNDKRLEVIKQFYDVSKLFDLAKDFALVKATYYEAAFEEIAFRDLKISPEDCLYDSFETALTIFSWGKFHKEDFDNCLNGIKKIESHILSEKFNLNTAYMPAAKVMLLAVAILHDVNPFEIDIAKNEIIKNPPYNQINKIKRIQPEAFDIASQAIELMNENKRK